MINHDLKLIFIHIPKCAGSSFESAFGHFSQYYGNGAQDHRTIRMIQQPWSCWAAFRSLDNMHQLVRRFAWNYYHKKHNPLNKNTVTIEQFQKYIRVSTIRNPWSRVVSWYHNVIESDYHLSRLKIRRDMPFNEFIFKYAGYGPLASQLSWLEGFDKEINFNYLVRFENIRSLVQDVAKTVGVSEVVLPHLIKSRSTDYRKHYNSESSEYIRTVYLREIKIFKFEFDDERRA